MARRTTAPARPAPTDAALDFAPPLTPEELLSPAALEALRAWDAWTWRRAGREYALRKLSRLPADDLATVTWLAFGDCDDCAGKNRARFFPAR